LWAISFLTEIQEPNVIRLNRLNTEEELGQVVQDSPGERVVIFTSAILQVTVSLVVEHLVGGEVHGGIQQLKDWKKRLKKKDWKNDLKKIQKFWKTKWKKTCAQSLAWARAGQRASPILPKLAQENPN
jgi:hypothetical protein